MPQWNNQDVIRFEENVWSVGDVVQFGEHFGIVSFFHPTSMTVCIARGTGTRCVPQRDVNMVVLPGTEVVPHDGSKLSECLTSHDTIAKWCPRTDISKQIAKRVPIAEVVQDGKT